jgi:hypothetical protein
MIKILSFECILVRHCSRGFCHVFSIIYTQKHQTNIKKKKRVKSRILLFIVNVCIIVGNFQRSFFPSSPLESKLKLKYKIRSNIQVELRRRRETFKKDISLQDSSYLASCDCQIYVKIETKIKGQAKQSKRE